MSEEKAKYLHIVVSTPDEYFVAVFSGMVDEIPVYTKVKAKVFTEENQLRNAAECAQELNRQHPNFKAITDPFKKKGEKK